MKDNGFFSIDGAHFSYYLNDNLILLFPSTQEEFFPYSFCSNESPFYIKLEGSRGIRGAIWSHSAYVEHINTPFNQVVELKAKYVYSRWAGLSIGGMDIFGDAVDDLFFIDNNSTAVLGNFKHFNSTPNTIETWTATFRGRQLHIMLLFENTLSFHGRNNLEYHPIIRVLAPGEEDCELLSGIYESILNFIRLIRYRVTCGSIETKLIDNNSNPSRIGVMLSNQEPQLFEKRYAFAHLSFWKPYIQKLLQFTFDNEDLSLQHLPVHQFHYSPRDFDPITFSRLFTAFENECHKNAAIYEHVHVSPTDKIRARILGMLKAEKKNTETEEELKFIDDSIDRISQLGTSMGQKAKIIRAFDSVYSVLESYLPFMTHAADLQDYRDHTKKLLSTIPSLRASILHDGNRSLISQEQADALIILESIVYIQMLRRAGIKDDDIKKIFGFVFEFNGGNYTYLTPD